MMMRKPDYQEEGIALYCGDSLEITDQIIEDESLDLIFTDPPYIKKYIHYYSWLAEMAKFKLKVNSLLVAYAGAYWKDSEFCRDIRASWLIRMGNSSQDTMSWDCFEVLGQIKDFINGARTNTP